MPNAALCAKAVVDMIVPGNDRNKGDGLADDVALPPEYVFTEERLEKVRKCETIAEQDEKGAFMLDLQDST